MADIIFTCETCAIHFTKPRHKNHYFRFCSLKCRANNNKIKSNHSLKMKGHIPWNKGTVGVMKPNYGSFKLGQRVSQSTEFKKGNIPQKPFKKGMTPWIKGKKFVSISTKREDDKKMRILFRGRVQRKVFERDDYTCQLCGIKGQDMQVDHLKSWSKHVESRFDLDNCRTLCAKCHYLITFGRNMPEKVSAWGHNLLGGRHI